MQIDKALILNIKGDNLHLLGLTPLHPYENNIQESKFFALLRILKNETADNDGFKWVNIPNSFGYADFIGFKIFESKAGYMIRHKYAQLI